MSLLKLNLNQKPHDSQPTLLNARNVNTLSTNQKEHALIYPHKLDD